MDDDIGTGSGGEEGRGRGTRTGARDMGQGAGTGTREHLHVDKNNDGPSYIIAIGEYKGRPSNDRHGMKGCVSLISLRDSRRGPSRLRGFEAL